MNLDSLNLDSFGAPGFSLDTRLDLSGHSSGSVDPHINSDIVNPSGNILRRFPEADFRDLIHDQLPGFNGMQDGL